MKSLEMNEMEKIEGGGPIGCTLGLISAGIATVALFTTPVTASLGVALLTSQGFVFSVVGAAVGCATDA